MELLTKGNCLPKVGEEYASKLLTVAIAARIRQFLTFSENKELRRGNLTLWFCYVYEQFVRVLFIQTALGMIVEGRWPY